MPNNLTLDNGGTGGGGECDGSLLDTLNEINSSRSRANAHTYDRRRVLQTHGARRAANLVVQGVHKDSLQFQEFITKANEKTDKWKLLQNETHIFKFSLPHLVHPYMGIISCTKHVKTVLDFLHDRCFPQMFLVVHSSLSDTVPVSINFMCHALLERVEQCGFTIINEVIITLEFA